MIRYFKMYRKSQSAKRLLQIIALLLTLWPIHKMINGRIIIEQFENIPSNATIATNNQHATLASTLRGPEFEDIMAERRDRVRTLCPKYQTKTCKNAFNIFLLPEQHFAWCAVWKSGTSFWIENLVKLSGQEKLAKRFDGKPRDQMAQVV